MKTKKLLLALPMVAILAGCSAKIVGYKDIFRKAKDLDQEVKDRVYNGFTGYNASMTYNVSTIVGQVESSEETSYTMSLRSNPETHRGDQVTIYDSASEVVANVFYDFDDGVYKGIIKQDPGFGSEAYFNAMRNAAFPWNGKLEIGDLLTCHKEGNEKLLDAASKNCTISGSVSSGDFTIRLNGSASYSDRDVKRTVSVFTVVYDDFIIKSYNLVYSIQIIETGSDVKVTKSINTTFERP